MADQSTVQGDPPIVALDNLELAFSKAMCDVLQNMVVQQNAEAQLIQASVSEALTDLSKSFSAATVTNVQNALAGNTANTASAGNGNNPPSASQTSADTTALQNQLNGLQNLAAQANDNNPAMTGIQYLGYAALIYSVLTASATTLAAKLIAYQEQVRFSQVSTIRAIQKTAELPAAEATAQIASILENYAKLGLGSADDSSLLMEELKQLANAFSPAKTTTPT